MARVGFSELSVSQLRARRWRLARSVGDPQATLCGTLQRQGRRCGRVECRCARGELHGPYLYLAVHGDGGARSIYVPGALVETVGALVEATAQREAVLAEISHINLELLRRRALE